MGASKSVVVTGASDGIGRGMAIAFARRGYSVGLIARRAEKLEEVASLCRAAGAPFVEYVAVDVTQSEAFRAALEKLDARFGGMEIFVANAGFGDEISVREDGGELARRMLDLNVTASIDGLEWVKAKMVARGRGRLVGMSSAAGIRGLPGAAVYSASKAALRVYLEGLAVETRKLGVHVTTIAPGFIATGPNLKSGRSMPFMMGVDRACEIFVRQTIAGRRWIVAPWQFGPAIWFLKYVPDSVYEALGFLYKDSSR